MYTLYQIISQLPITTPRKIARLCGKLVSCMFVLGNSVQLKTRRLHHIIATRSGWDTLISIEGFPRAIKDIFFWKHDFYTPASLAYSDASSTSIAAHVNVHNEEKIAYRNLSETECLKSSTWKELSAIAFAVNSFKDIVSSKTILWHTDNFAASCVLKSGSNKSELQTIAEIFFIYVRNTVLGYTLGGFHDRKLHLQMG